MSIPKIIPLTKGSGMTKAERKAYYAEQEKLKNEAIWKAWVDDLKSFTDNEKATGNLTKDIGCYLVGINNYNIYIDEEPKPFPSGFPIKDAIIFDNTYVIGFDTNNITYEVEFEYGVKCIPHYSDCTPEQKAEYDKHIEAGDRSNSKMLIYNKNDLTMVHSAKINIWKTPIAFDCWYKIQVRPNRIYLSDFDGFKIFDFELNLIYFKPITTHSGLYGFKVNPENWNNVWVWSVNEAKDEYGRDRIDEERSNSIYKSFYSDMSGFEDVCEYIST